MKHTQKFIAALGAVLLTVCAFAKTDYVLRELTPNEPFSALNISSDVEVRWTQQPEVSVRVRGPEALVNGLQVQVENNTLSVRFNGNARIKDKVSVAITAPHLSMVSVGAGGEVDIVGALKTDSLVVVLSDHGEFALNNLTTSRLHITAMGKSEAEVDRINAQTVYARIAGRADVELSGLAQTVTLENEGSGELDASELRAPNGVATVKGRGDIKISAYEQLTASVSGRGRIVYKGSPVHIQQTGPAGHIVADRDD